MARQQVVHEIAQSILSFKKDIPLRVGIDGIDAAGKTSLANELAEELTNLGHPVLRASIDGFHNPKEIRRQRGNLSPEGYYHDSFNYSLLTSHLLQPLEPHGNRRIRLSAFDFKTEQETTAEELTATNEHILIFEGVFLFRPELIRYWDVKIFVEINFETSLDRALERDLYLFGSKEEIENRYKARYLPGQKMYIEAEHPQEKADIILDNNDFTKPIIMQHKTTAANRILHWQGCNNVRDLGGMETSNGCKTRWGAIVRGDQPAKLTETGWDALYKHGIRTIVSLRTHGFDEKDHPVVTPPYSDINVVSVEIEDVTHQDFVEKWATSDLWGTPLYWTDALTHWPHRHAAALQAITQAQPGGVYFHCIRGYDRTGIIAFLTLSLAGVSLKDITADYEVSVDSVRDKLLAGRNTNTYEVIKQTLAGIDIKNYLLSGGMTQSDITALRTRLLLVDN